MVDLTTSYLGLNLKNPLVASSSPLTASLDNVRRMEDAGAAAIVMHSLFEEQITLAGAQQRNAGADVPIWPERLTSQADLREIYLGDVATYNQGPDAHFEHLYQAKKAVGIPVIASLNGTSGGEWTRYAAALEDAGADAVELNTYYLPTSLRTASKAVEQRYCDLVKQVKNTVQIPVAVKLNPYFSSLANMAQKLNRAGAKGLALFNRFYLPDFDLERMEVIPNLALSDSSELTLRLHWVAILYGRVKADFAVTGGVHTAQDVVKAIAAGANVAMMTSALLKHGVGHFAKVLADLRHWMEARKYQSIRALRGQMALQSIADSDAFERANYIRVIASYGERAATAASGEPGS